MPEVARLPSGQEQPAQHRPKRLWRQVRAGVCRDHLGRRVCLLGRDSALLDREAGEVAGGEDVGKTVHLSVRVDRNESLDRLRQAVDPRPAQAWQGDDAVGRDASLGDEAQLVIDELDRAGARLDGDPPLLEQLAHRLASRAAEQLQRLVLRGDERQLDVVELALGEVGRGHQGELVDRQRPDGSPGHDEGDPSRPTGDDLPEEVADSLGVRRAAEGQGAGVGTAPQATSRTS
jgi:hypothetical protein